MKLKNNNKFKKYILNSTLGLALFLMLNFVYATEDILYRGEKIRIIVFMAIAVFMLAYFATLLQKNVTRFINAKIDTKRVVIKYRNEHFLKVNALLIISYVVYTIFVSFYLLVINFGVDALRNRITEISIHDVAPVLMQTLILSLLYSGFVKLWNIRKKKMAKDIIANSNILNKVEKETLIKYYNLQNVKVFKDRKNKNKKEKDKLK